MEIVAGKKYRMRNGEAVTLKESNDGRDAKYPFSGKEPPNYCYTGKGALFSDEESDCDIVAEWEDDAGWIMWAGGKCPVDTGDRVDVKFRSGEIELNRPRDFRWEHIGMSGDIVAYRIVGFSTKGNLATKAEPVKTLRDEFAMAALAGFRANPQGKYTTYPDHAEEAYRYADAMLAEKKKGEQNE